MDFRGGFQCNTRHACSGQMFRNNEQNTQVHVMMQQPSNTRSLPPVFSILTATGVQATAQKPPSDVLETVFYLHIRLNLISSKLNQTVVKINIVHNILDWQIYFYIYFCSTDKFTWSLTDMLYKLFLLLS